MFYLGLLAFVLFFLSDFNDVKLHRRYLILCFPLGSALFMIAAFFQLDVSAAPITGPLWRSLFWALALVSAALLCYTLFFSFPASSAYTAPGTKRPVYNKGFYAMCRHPGLLWAALLLFSLWLVCGLPFYAALIYTLLDLALVLYEDIYVFPIVLSGYDVYKKSTPFFILLPNCIKTASAKERTGSVAGR